MGLDNYWMFDREDVTGLEPGAEVEYEVPDGDGGTITETYDVEGDDEAIPTWVADEAGCPEAPEFDDNLGLVGGIVSGHGPHSFRGKVYSGFVQHVTGRSLYVERMDNDEVAEVADALDDLEWAELDESSRRAFHGKKDEFESFRTMFREMADAGAWLTGWW